MGADTESEAMRAFRQFLATWPHWLGTVDGHRCACGCLTANNGTRRLCPACGAVVPLGAPWQQRALFGEDR